MKTTTRRSTFGRMSRLKCSRISRREGETERDSLYRDVLFVCVDSSVASLRFPRHHPLTLPLLSVIGLFFFLASFFLSSSSRSLSAFLCICSSLYCIEALERYQEKENKEQDNAPLPSVSLFVGPRDWLSCLFSSSAFSRRVDIARDRE